ncbi:serine dehydratase subunit alpha family protein [Clostridium ihumii]|uniref:L-cysteine desulfidase family protein n=1 Tax=Clostridium ihumii TaxID=1470356 RepID=UPI000555A45E|nr:L-serine ammonia-lyase, iron-sulfur-dependent, subunit alpha [Clostridium ihumii]
MNYNEITELLKVEVVPALGCTEPIAIAMATAKGASYLKNGVEKIELFLSTNIIKNAMSVGIPGTGANGIDIAAALGAVAGNADLKLEVLRDCNQEDVAKAKKMVADKKVSVQKADRTEKLYIEAICISGDEKARVVIKYKHTNITLVEVNGEIIYANEDTLDAPTEDSKNNKKKLELSVAKIYEYATTVPFEDIKFLLDGAEMNSKVAEEGLKKEYGLKIGKTLMEQIDKGILSDDIMSFTMAFTAAGSDARMSGCPLPVMSSAGSGNQGLTAILPVVAVSKKLECSDETLARALAISHLTTYYIKSFLGRLSALCGCGVAASIGASSAMTYMMGGKLENVCYTIKNMIGDVSGMICDGAKPGCALKLSTAVSSSVKSAILAAHGIEISDKDGIVSKEADDSIRNLATIANNGMTNCDNVILDIMICK